MATDELTIHYADGALIVADKPAGLLAVPGRGPEKQDCLSRRIAAVFPDALVVHRLDMDTSGLICFARSAATQRQVSIAFAQRAVRKGYLAVVEGHLAGSDDWQLIDLPLAVDWPNRPRSQVDPVRGKPSQTRWRVSAHDAGGAWTRVELEPITGRSHQLRVHLAALGHPIVGDPLYGDQSKAARMQLHACRLALPHPKTGEVMSFESPPPF